MGFESVDQLQNFLAKNVFGYTKDAKKASGRALGTFVEIITFYLLESWGFSKHISIEEGLLEFGNETISHNVEYTLHPIGKSYSVTVRPPGLPITSSKILSALTRGNHALQPKAKSNSLVSSDRVLRNSCMIGSVENVLLMAAVEKLDSAQANIIVTEQYPKPFAMVECKRVGVEEGTRKGPQTIEKAKQGAYVAKAVSSLQKIRNREGTLYGTIPKDGSFYIKPYGELVEEVISSKDSTLYRDFILTVGVVSNHGNWFTSNNPNKELLVLAQSYDWLIFLTDKGITEFITKLLVSPEKRHEPVKRAFEASYQNRTTKNQFTKVQMQYDAHLLLLDYFRENASKIETWFNVITPKSSSLQYLQEQLKSLAGKEWEKAR